MSKPVELYRLVMGSDVWTFTSGDTSVIYNDELYVPVTIGRGGAESKNELSKANLEVRLDLMHELSRLLLSTFQEQVLTMTLFRQDQLSTEVFWKGRLASIKPSTAYLTLTFESVFTSLRRHGLRARYQTTCRHTVYERGCWLDMNDWKVPAQVTALSGSLVTVPEAAALGADFFNGGMLRSSSGLLAYVIGHNGDQITLMREMPSLTEDFAANGYGMNYGVSYGGTAIELYPGCNQLRGTCHGRFGNLLNYGGFDWIPSKNPMGGSSIV